MAENVEYEGDFMQDQRKIDDKDAEINQQSFSTGSDEWQVKPNTKQIISEIKKQLQRENVMSEEEETNINDLWQLPLQDRWRLYRKWVSNIRRQHENTITTFQPEYDKGMKELKELYNAKNYEILQDAHIIGMTTTGNLFLISLLLIIFLKGLRE